MSDQPQGLAASDHFVESIERLSKKSGVLATIVIDRSNGVVLNTTGTLSSIRSPSDAVAASAASLNNLSEDGSGEAADESGLQDMAKMVWNYMAATKELVQGLDTQDEVKLLRLRTKKYELMIVPDMKYVLVVVHDTPTTN